MINFAPLAKDELDATEVVSIEAAPDEAARIAKAKEIISKSSRITGTPAEAYLTGRGIDVSRLPSGIVGWHGESRSMVVLARTATGDVQACQRLFFDVAGNPVLKENGQKKRCTNGLLKGSAVTIPGAGTTLITEGAEDAMTLWQVTGQPCLGVLGKSNFKDAPLSSDASVILVADNDLDMTAANEAVKALHDRGLNVSMAVPADAKDSNELLTKRGAEAVLAMVAAAKPFESSDQPIPLFPDLSAPKPYPVEAMGPLQAVTRAIVRKVQVPSSTAAQSVLAVAALAAQAHANVVLPYGQKRPLSMFFATIAGSGDRKSSADNEASWPVHKHEKKLREEHKDAVKEWRIASLAWNAERKRIEADRKTDLAGKKVLLEAIGDEPLQPLEPFISLSDLTLDGVTKNWIKAPASLAIMTSEGATFTGGHGMSEDNRLRTAASLSEVWDGRAIKRVRALDGVTILPGRRLSLHVMIQPDAANGFLGDAALRDQGLLSRVLVASPASIAGSRLYRDPAPGDESAIRKFGGDILRILEAAPAMVKGARNELDPRDLPIMPEASALWVKFFNFVEEQSGPNGELAGLRDLASKAAEHAARLAGVLTIIGDRNAANIDIGAMENAITLMNWYLGEAERLQSTARIDPRLLRASALLDWMRDRSGREILFRDILRTGPSVLRTKAAAEEAVGILKEHRWLDEVPEARSRTLTLREEKSGSSHQPKSLKST